NQIEMVRPIDLGLAASDVAGHLAGALEALRQDPQACRDRLVRLLREQQQVAIGDRDLDETLISVRQQMRKFAEREIAPQAQRWHQSNQLIPLALVDNLARLGVFGITVPEEFGGMGLGRQAMCLAAEELSR